MEYSKIVELVKEAGRIAYSEDLRKEVSVKGDADFVTAIDLRISAFLKEKLRAADPSIGFFCEEEKGCLKDPSWILDPIDGTTNLIFGYRLSSVSLALYRDGAVRFGVVYNPFTKECFTAEEGKGAWLCGRRLAVSRREMKNALVEFGAGSTHKEDAEQNFEIAKKIFTKCVDIRRICSSALDLCYIADGRIDGYFERNLKPWDIAAGGLILSEAGGKMTDYNGQEIRYSGPTSLIAGNGIVNQVILETVHRVENDLRDRKG